MNQQEWQESSDPAAMLGHLLTPRHPQATDRKLRLFGCLLYRTCRFHISDHDADIIEKWIEGELTQGQARDGCRYGSWVLLGDDAALAARQAITAYHSRTSREAAHFLRGLFGDLFCPKYRWFRGKLCAVIWLKNEQGNKTGVAEWCEPVEWHTPLIFSLAEGVYQHRLRKRCEKCRGAGAVSAMVKGFASSLPGFSNAEGRSRRCEECAGAGYHDTGVMDRERLLVLSDALEEAGCGDEDVLTSLRADEPRYRGFWVVDLLSNKA